MKKILVLTMALFTMNSFSNEKNSIFLNYCSNFGTGVNYSFQSCVNSNFSTIQREIGGFFSYCTNFGSEVDYGFTSCVNQGFREAQRQLSNSVYLPDCFSFDRKTLDYSFISCANSNFSTIAREVKFN